MKKIITLFLLFLVYTEANTQVTFRLGLSGSAPVGDMSDYYVAGAGIDANVKYLVGGNLGIGISSGFRHFFAKDWQSNIDDINFNMVPIHGVIAYYFGKGLFRPYVGAELGLLISKLEYNWSGYDAYNGYTYYESSTYSNTRFSGAGIAGFEIELGRIFALDFNGKYNFAARTKDDSPHRQGVSYISAGLGFVLKFGGKG